VGAFAGLLLVLAGLFVGLHILFPVGLLLFVACTVIAVVQAVRTPPPPPRQVQPVGYTPEGQPIHPVVGYTPDGRPVTADRAIGYQPLNPHTNGTAIAALVLGFVFPILAIPFGHVALSQIRRTGERGNGMALTGLILGYLQLAFVVVVLIALGSGLFR
jgi:hypothetical protein